MPSLDDLDDLVSKKEAESKVVKENKAEEKKESTSKKLDDTKKIVVNKKTNALENINKNNENKRLDSNQKIDLFSDDSINYSKEMSDIINNSEKYSIFEKDVYTSEISSALTGIIEENEESINNKDIKK